MRTLFCVFSGTGNTLRASTRFAEELRSLGHEAEIYSIKNGAPMPAVDGFDTLVVAYPIHAFNAPANVLKFLKNMPEGGGMPCYLLRTSGEPSKLNDASGITPKRILKKRGYNVLGEFAYVMPYNIIFRHSDGMVARMVRAMETRIPVDARKVVEGAAALRKVDPLRRLAAFTLRIEHTAMPFIGHSFRTTEKCVGCGKCEKVCPLGNITMKDGKPSFGRSCVGCMGCSFSCPSDAVKIAVLNGWRVNGGYSFEGEPATDEEVCRYLHKIYLRYFHESESINAAPMSAGRE